MSVTALASPLQLCERRVTARDISYFSSYFQNAVQSTVLLASTSCWCLAGQPHRALSRLVNAGNFVGLPLAYISASTDPSKAYSREYFLSMPIGRNEHMVRFCC
jgi:hypothetical protein